MAAVLNKPKKIPWFQWCSSTEAQFYTKNHGASKTGAVVRRNPGMGNRDESAELIHQINGLKLTVENLEKKRDFYFGKLKDIELFCRENKGKSNPVLQRIVEILGATREGLVIPDEGGPQEE